MFLIAGLGNPEVRYFKTRHNMGYLAVDALCDKWHLRLERTGFKGVYTRERISGQDVMIIKPTTYMNLSGECLRAVMDYYKIPTENILVMYDDIDLPAGDLRVRMKGGPGTHNGMRSILTHLGTEDFPRIRIGVGAPQGGKPLVDHVMGIPPQEEWQVLDAALKGAADAAEAFVLDGIEAAMRRQIKQAKAAKPAAEKEEK